MEQDFINEELQKRLNADEEVQKIKEELKENLESKLRIKELEIKVTLLENTNNN